MMDKDQLIAKQQLQIEEYKDALRKNAKTVKELKGRFIGMGQPMNDNILQFNNKQLTWCAYTLQLVESIVTKIDEHNDN